MNPRLVFLKNEAGEAEGLNDPGIETFRDSPYSSVARETGQNTRDVRADTSKPVRMAFRKIDVPTSEFPDIESYRAAVKTCLDLAKRSSDTKELSFFRQARRVLEKDTIAVLEISDYNTHGLRGPCTDGTPFHALVKATGVSAKDMETSGGSFGIGKNAVYAASDLQTAFYSTVYTENGSSRFLCQGKTRFRSFVAGDGTAHRSIGYWGDPQGFQPIGDPADVPGWMRRDEVGTSIFSIAMRDANDWEAELIASILMNFFAAIHREDMEFEVGSETINARTLLYKFDEPRIQRAAERTGNKEDFDFARNLYDCLREGEDIYSLDFDVAGAGKFKIRLGVKAGLPRRIAFIRNGMFITDSLGSFGDKLQRFPMFREFAAIVEPAGEKESVWLKSLENPRHDQLSPDRLTNPDDREAARTAGRALAKAVREQIRSKAKSEAGAETDLDELSEFFANEEKAEPDEKGDRDPYSFKVKKQVRVKKARKTKPPASNQSGDRGGGSQEGENEETGGRGGTGAGEGDGTGGSGKRSVRVAMPLLNPRTLIPDSSNLAKRIIKFTPEKSGPALLQFEALGLNRSEPLSVKDGQPSVVCEAGKRMEVEVEFDAAYTGPIEIISWQEENKNEAQ
ncbi:hypothetical protein [Altererythrobacter rubellus]|uniref:Uncharacterized protein n=1 Tax=Altererythrobacter rubellus TaxID=2173831 RepID=A0A9Y2B9G3_9SPHN|nr:hypothetical protein [Altererythrobacter rubellus]WIW95465.1 hypothetical protein QQX03_11105 [Altererythrobacter rubellus]